MNLSADWMTQAQNIAANTSPAMSALEIMGAAIIFMMLCCRSQVVCGGAGRLSRVVRRRLVGHPHFWPAPPSLLALRLLER